MEIETLDIEKIIESSQDKNLSRTLNYLAEKGVEEIAIAVHSAFDLSPSTESEKAKENYFQSTKNYLEFCKDFRIPVVHFRDMLNSLFGGKNEQNLYDTFGTAADYEVATFPNKGVPIDLTKTYFEQFNIYGIFRPEIILPKHNIQTVNGIGCFTDASCFQDGLSVMESIATSEVRVIQEATISRDRTPFNMQNIANVNGLPDEKIKPYLLQEDSLVPHTQNKQH